jgi:hypothetical protein
MRLIWVFQGRLRGLIPDASYTNTIGDPEIVN